MFKNILIATNGSQGSEAAVSTGLQLAQEHGATAHILYVVETMATKRGISPWMIFGAIFWDD